MEHGVAPSAFSAILVRAEGLEPRHWPETDQSSIGQGSSIAGPDVPHPGQPQGATTITDPTPCQISVTNDPPAIDHLTLETRIKHVCESDPALSVIVDSWPALPQPIRDAILGIVHAVKKAE